MDNETKRSIYETYFMDGETIRFVCASYLPHTIDGLPGGRIVFNCYPTCRAQGGVGQGCLLEYWLAAMRQAPHR